jgi:hypothetical protein
MTPGVFVVVLWLWVAWNYFTGPNNFLATVFR